MIFVGRLAPVLALGWVVLAVVLVKWLPPASVAQVLMTLALAEAIATLIVPSLDPMQGSETRNDITSGESILLIWIFGLPALLVAQQVGALPIYADTPLATLSLATLCLLIALLRLSHRCGRGVRVLIAMRMLILGGTAYGLQLIGSNTAEVFLLMAVLLMLVLLLLVSRPLINGVRHRSGRARKGPTLHDVAPILLRQIDLLVLPWVLHPRQVLAYLLARGFAAFVTVILDQLMIRAYQATKHATGTSQRSSFPAEQAARVNLGALLIGGAAALALLSLLPYAPQLLGQTVLNVSDVAGWLILATLGSAVFGTAPVWMDRAGLKREMTGLYVLSTAAFMTSILAQPHVTAITLAQITALVQLVMAAAAAALLTWRTGVWPGLTAVLIRQIKLF